MARKQTGGPARTRLTKLNTEPDLSPRALGAMAEAARRSREGAGGRSPETTHRPRSPRTDPHPVAAPAPPVEEAPSNRDRRLKASVTLVAAALVVAAVGLGVSAVAHDGSGPTHRSARTGTGVTLPTKPRSMPTTTSPASTGPSPATASSPTTVPSSTTTAPPPASGSGPVLSALSPSSGSAGQSVVVVGMGFLSSDGNVLASFDGQVAPTVCPIQTTCTITVPAMSDPPPTVPVTITTASGTSNALSFAYQQSSASLPNVDGSPSPDLQADTGAPANPQRYGRHRHSHH
jgi:hypothetical protein